MRNTKIVSRLQQFQVNILGIIDYKKSITLQQIFHIDKIDSLVLQEQIFEILKQVKPNSLLCCVDTL